jgi:hypothetical protein
MRLDACGPTVAWLTTNPAGNTIHLCQHCLDWWFDEADEGRSCEPAAWGRLGPTSPLRDSVAKALRDPANRSIVREVLQREARARAPWLVGFIERENRMVGVGRVR